MGAHCESLILKDFTAFSDIDISLSPGINAFVGENGTGKTHAMKVLYAWMLSQSFKEAERLGFVRTLMKAMHTESESALVRFGSKAGRSTIRVGFGGHSYDTVLFAAEGDHGSRGELKATGIERPVFLPAVDMMGHTKGFVSMYDEYPLDFDYTYRDIVHLLSLSKREPTPQYQAIVSELESVLGGKVEQDERDNRFYLVVGEHRQEMPLVAEGLRKIATLLILLRNGSIRSGTTLFWDEPEVNINPNLMDDIIDVLIEISSLGVQIILATHSYVILKELDLRTSATQQVRFFAFETAKTGTAVHETEKLSLLQPNKILDHYTEIYDQEIRRKVIGVRDVNRSRKRD